MSGEKLILLFVYGELRKGKSGHYLMSDCRFLGEVSTKPKYFIAELKNGLLGLKEGDQSVSGELYAVPSNKMGDIDDYEWGLYERRSIELPTINKPAQAYFLKDYGK